MSRCCPFLTVLAVCWLAVTVRAAEAPAQVDDAAALRRSFLALIDRPRVPLAAEVRPQPEPAPDLLAERVAFDVATGDRVPGLVVRPRSDSGRRAAVIVLHGTNSSKEGVADRLNGLARAGFVAVAIDGRYHGERRAATAAGDPYADAILRAYKGSGEHPFLYDTVWDVMRLIDYLETRADVDPQRIGLTGFSKGGIETYLAAAVEPRIAAAVSIRGVQGFGWALEHAAWDSRAWTIRAAIDEAARQARTRVTPAFVKQFYDAAAPGLYDRFDAPAMVPLVAPRPLLAINGDSDPRTPMAGVRLTFQAAQRAYRAHGADERLYLHVMHDTGHEDPAEVQDLMTGWFVRWLLPR